MPSVTVESHRIPTMFYVRVSELDLLSIQFPFPLLTEAGLTLLTEDDQPLAIEGGTAVAIPLLGGVVPPQKLHVVGEG